jgi:hypothetical protein
MAGLSPVISPGVHSACRWLVCGAMLAAALVPWPLVADDTITISKEIDAVMNEAARLGVPVLAVASTDSCREAPVLKRQLAGNPVLQPLVGRFAVVELRMSGDDKWDWHRWQDRFNTHRRNTPQVFVIRADGRLSFSGDPPADLAGFLSQQLDRNGQPIAPRQADQFEAQLAAASRLQAEGDLAGAVGSVMPAVRMPSFARPIVQSVAFRAAVAEGLMQRIAHDPGAKDPANPDAGEQNAGKEVSATDRLAAVEEIVAASEQFVATLPEVARAATKRLVEMNRDPEGKETVRQAQLLHRAAVAARRSPDRGRSLYQQILEIHPDSPAAQLAAMRLERLDARSP